MDANEILEGVETTHERVSPYIRECANVFHDNEGELFTRTEAVELLAEEVDIDATIAREVLAQLVGDTVDPIVQVVDGSEKYIGVIEFHEFDGAYGYINYDDQFGQGKRVVCQQCVNEATLDSEVTHATANDPMGSFADGASWDELLAGVHQHYAKAHDTVPEDVETGATLASGTTIGGNTAFHAGNESSIEHDNLSSRTHSGDSISPNNVTTSTLEADGSLSGPTASEGDVVTLPDNPEVIPIYFDAQTGEPLVPDLRETI